MTRLCAGALLALLMAAGAAAETPPAPLRADYGLRDRRVTRRQLGLGASEVMLVPFSPVSSYAREGHRFDEHVLKLAAAGLVNRDGPLVWLDMVDFMGGPRSNLAAELEWRRYYAETRRWRFRPQQGGLDGLLRRIAPLLNGLVVYDGGPGTARSDDVVLALNLANANRCLPMSRTLYARHRAALRGVPVIARTGSVRWSRARVYDWLLREVFTRLDRTAAHSLCASFPDVRQRDDYSFLHGLDYAFYRRCPIFNLTPLRAPSTEAGFAVDGSSEMAALFDRVMQALGPRPAAVLGWNEPEPPYVERVSAHGHYVNCTAAASDLSFHAAVRPLAPPPYRQSGRPRAERPGRKVYVAFVANEGDAIKSQALMYNRAWAHHPGRGSVAINWAVNPASVRLWPAVFEYFARTRTPNDYFVGAPNGAGYANPGANPWLDGYLRHVRRAMPLMDIRELGIWYPTRDSVDAYAAQLPGLRGIDLTPVPGAPSGELFTVGPRATPVARYSPSLWYWQTQTALQRDYHIDVPQFKAHLEALYNAGPLPAFANVYGVEANLVGEIARLAAALDPDRFEIVDCATFFHLAAQVARPAAGPMPGGAAPPWSAAMLTDLSAWTERMNDAVVEVAGSKLRVGVAPGKTWAIAAVRAVSVPPGATRVRVRVGALRGAGAAWVVKLFGDLDGFGHPDNWHFGSTRAPTVYEAPLDLRVRHRGAGPYMLQVGVTGPEGSSVEYLSIEFLR